VRWTWSSKSRVADGHDEENYRSSTGDAQPDFICVGPQKTGTGWLYQQLASHPDFWMPPTKELHYFDQLGRPALANPARPRDERDLCFLKRLESLSARPHVDLKNYARLFEPKGSLLSGDISPGYSTLSCKIIQRVVGYFPKLKVIFLARDPVERAWSHMSMEVRSRQIQPFDVADMDEVIRNLRRRGMLLRSYPSVIAARWQRYVHPELFRIYFFDDLQRDPAGLRRSILEFLRADPNKASGRLTADYNSKAGMEKLRFTDKVRSRMAQFFEKELKACAAKLGGSARDWPARYGFSFSLFLSCADQYLDLYLWVDWCV